MLSSLLLLSTYFFEIAITFNKLWHFRSQFLLSYRMRSCFTKESSNEIVRCEILIGLNFDLRKKSLGRGGTEEQPWWSINARVGDWWCFLEKKSMSSHYVMISNTEKRGSLSFSCYICDSKHYLRSCSKKNTWAVYYMHAYGFIKEQQRRKQIKWRECMHVCINVNSSRTVFLKSHLG